LRRVGESLPRKVDVRLVTATHRDLDRMVREGRFREDLYYRLKVATVSLPPLRERGRDLILLARHVLAHHPGAAKAPRLSAEARRHLAGYSWPGNIRELENVLRVAVALAEDGTIRPQHLDLPRRERAPRTDYHRQVEAFRRRLVEEALAAGEGNRAEAARRLGLSRQALSYLVRQLKLV
jgi:sigma-54-dependent transcriptional regulator